MTGKPRGFETLRDMVLSLAVVGAVVLAIFLVVVWQRPEVQGDIRPAVDVDGFINQVELTDPFPVSTPALPSGWTPNSAWFEGEAEWPGLDGSVLHLGYLTPSGSYAEVKQSNGDTDFIVSEWADDGQAVGTVSIGGREWQRLEAETGKLALLSPLSPSPVSPESKSGVTVLVSGKADWPELEQVAAALQASN